MIWAFILHQGVMVIVFTTILLSLNALAGAYYPDSDSVRENRNTLAVFLLAGGVLVAIGGVGLMLIR